MAALSKVAKALRSKNAGPFWVTIDVFLPSDEVFERVSASLSTEQVANVLHLGAEQVKRYDLPEIAVIKFSFPRHVVQGHRLDRDMHGAQYALLLCDLQC